MQFGAHDAMLKVQKVGRQILWGEALLTKSVNLREAEQDLSDAEDDLDDAGFFTKPYYVSLSQPSGYTIADRSVTGM
jgi:hypothetical protein